MRSTRFLPPAELAVVRVALDAAGCVATLGELAAKLVPPDGLRAAEVLRRAESVGELAAVRKALAGIVLPHRGGAEARRTTATTLRLRHDEDAALRQEAADRGITIARTVGALALEAQAKKLTEP